MESYAPPENDGPAKADGTPSGTLAAQLPSPVILREHLEKLGISDSSHIVVFWDDNMRLIHATRLMFTLQYLGLSDQSSLLNGGLPEWKRLGKPVSTDVPGVNHGSLKPRPVQDVSVEYGFVKRLPEQQGAVLVDARTREFYDGDKASFNVSGHLPGAVDIPVSEFLNGKNTVDLDNMRTKFAAAGVKSTDTVVTYCHIGLEATVPYFAARLMGQKALVYDGSVQDWSTNARGPIVPTKTGK